MFIYKDGDPTDLTLTFDIKDTEINDDGNPYVDIDIKVESDNFNYNSVASVDYQELIDLKDTLDRFVKGTLNGYCVWNHIEGDIEFAFDKLIDIVTLKVFFVPATRHMSGIYFDFCSDDAKELSNYINTKLNK